MAWYRSTNSSKVEPSAEERGRRVYESQGKKHSTLDYSSTLHTESRMSQTGRLHGFVRVPVPVPPQINFFNDPADGFDEHSKFPPITAYGSPKKAEGFFPMERLPWNSAGYKNQTPFSWDNDDHSSTDASDVDDNDEWHGGYGGSYSPDYGMGSPKGKPSSVRHAGRLNQQYTAPWSKPETDTQSPKAGWKPLFEPPAARHPQYSAPVTAAPRKDAYPETARNRPIVLSRPWSKPETDTQSSKASWKPLFEPPGARHPQYSASVPASPEKDMSYETAHNRPIGPGPPRSEPETGIDYAMESPKARQQGSFVPDYYAPDTTPPKKDAYYGTTNNSPIVPSPLRSKPESGTGYASDSPKAGRNPSFGSPSERRPQHTIPVKEPYNETANNSKPSHDNVGKGMRRENQETIDSREARKRYGGKSSKQQPLEEGHVGTIDCREAAKKYNGIFVP